MRILKAGQFLMGLPETAESFATNNNSRFGMTATCGETAKNAGKRHFSCNAQIASAAAPNEEIFFN